VSKTDLRVQKTAVDHPLPVQFEDAAASKTTQQRTPGDDQIEAGGTIPTFQVSFRL